MPQDRFAAAITKLGEIGIVRSDDRTEFFDRLIEELFVHIERDGFPIELRVLREEIAKVFQRDPERLGLRRRSAGWPQRGERSPARQAIPQEASVLATRPVPEFPNKIRVGCSKCAAIPC